MPRVRATFQTFSPPCQTHNVTDKTLGATNKCVACNLNFRIKCPE